MKKIINLILIWCCLATATFAQFAEPGITGANFVPNTINPGETSMLTVSFSNTGSTPVPMGSIEVTISTADDYYTTDGTTVPGGIGGAFFSWVYTGATDTWRGTNMNDIPAFDGGDITLQVTGNNESSNFEVTNINVQIDGMSGSSFSNDSGNDNLQPGLDVTVVACNINVALWLEGSYDPILNEMRTDLNDQQLLPGQDPVVLLGQETPAGQPYDISPWLYNGTEGDAYNYNTVGNVKANYDADVVDWVLVSLRTSKLASSTFCTQAAWLMKDGTVTFPAGCNCTLTVGQQVYIVIEHRNHLPIMTPDPVSVTGAGVGFDFRNQQSYLTFTGDGQKVLEGGVFGMFAANGDQTSALGARTDVNATDESIWTSQNSTGDTYNIGDFDMNGDINANDESLWLENTGKSSDVNY